VKELRRFTPARVGLGRAGNSVPTAELLAFQLAHARARDAVHDTLDAAAVRSAVEAEGWQALLLKSAARARTEYLRRPDLGRKLESGVEIHGKFDIAFVIADGLSARAVERQAVPFLKHVIPGLPHDSIAPVAIVEQARVAIGDEIGYGFGADIVVVLIGERPGLSAPDSMGIYMTWNPRPGRIDSERNCISNIRPGGLHVGAAAQLLLLLMSDARSRKISGVNLKAPGMNAPSLPGLA
jgi:ethanolamine ammonia-lyase small subunit